MRMLEIALAIIILLSTLVRITKKSTVCVKTNDRQISITKVNQLRENVKFQDLTSNHDKAKSLKLLNNGFVTAMSDVGSFLTRVSPISQMRITTAVESM